MLVADDTVSGGVRTKILDFGLAKLLPQVDPSVPGAAGPASPPASLSAPSVTPFSPRSVKTSTGVLMGTPMYMSPEQCRGSVPPDGKIDVYALGIIFYELLYGEPPFVSDSAGELYAMHLFAPAPELTELVPAINRPLAALVHRMLDKKAAARPSMEELLVELEALPDSGLMDGPLDYRPSALPASAEGIDGKAEGTSDLIRRQLARRGPKGNRAAILQPGQASISGAPSLGEQVAAQRRPQSLGVLAAGAATFVLVSATVFLLAGPPLKAPAAPSPPAAAVRAPAAAAAAPTAAPPVAAPPVAAPPLPEPAPASPPKKGTAIAARPHSKEKTSRRKSNGSKKASGNYNVNLWK